MTYLRYQQLKPEDFKRLCGVHHQTFTRMVAVLEEQVEQKKLKPGKPSKLSVADQVFLSLEYSREYRSYFHIGQAWGVHESTVSRIVRKVENARQQSWCISATWKKATA
jgi:predicted transcriptional regulator